MVLPDISSSITNALNCLDGFNTYLQIKFVEFFGNS